MTSCFFCAMADPADKGSAATANGSNIFFIFSSRVATSVDSPGFKNCFGSELIRSTHRLMRPKISGEAQTRIGQLWSLTCPQPPQPPHCGCGRLKRKQKGLTLKCRSQVPSIRTTSSFVSRALSRGFISRVLSREFYLECVISNDSRRRDHKSVHDNRSA